MFLLIIFGLLRVVVLAPKIFVSIRIILVEGCFRSNLLVKRKMAYTNMQQSKKRKRFQKEDEIHITARYISSYRHEIKHVLEANTVFAGGVDLIVAYSDVTLLTLSHRFLNKLYQKWYPTMILPSGAEPFPFEWRGGKGWTSKAYLSSVTKEEPPGQDSSKKLGPQAIVSNSTLINFKGLFSQKLLLLPNLFFVKRLPTTTTWVLSLFRCKTSCKPNIPSFE